MSDVNLKLKIKSKWFENQFFVIQADWNSTYSIILGYDFLQRNKISMDIPNKQLIMGNDKFEYEENNPSESQNNNLVQKDQSKCSSLIARAIGNIRLPPNSNKIIKLKISEKISECKQIMFTPKFSKIKFSLPESVHNVIDDEYFFSIIKNNTNANMNIRKSSNLGKIMEFENEQSIDPSEKECYQVNNLNLTEILKLRKEELNESDFDLNHLNSKDKKDMLNNYKVFSKNYKLLIPQFLIILVKVPNFTE